MMSRLSILVRISYIAAVISISTLFTNKKNTYYFRDLQENGPGTEQQSSYEGLSGLRTIVTGLEHSGNSVIGTLLNNAPCVMGALETGYLLAETPADIENIQPWFNWHLKVEKESTPHNYMLSPDDINAMKSTQGFPEMLDMLRERSHIFNDLNEEPYCPSPTQMIDNTPRYVHPQYFADILSKTPGVPVIVTKKPFEDQKKSIEKRGMSISREVYDSVYNNVYKMVEKYPNRIKIIDFDEFMFAPNAVMEDVFQFLDLDWDPEYLNMLGIIKKWKGHPQQINWYEGRQFHHEDIENLPEEQTIITNELDTLYDGAWKKQWENAFLLPSNLHTGINFTPDVPTLLQFWVNYWSPIKEEVNEELLWSRFMNVGDLFDHFPPPLSTDTLQIYNEKAYNELIQVLIESQGTIKIVANGGSPTAGGGLDNIHLRYYTMFTKYIQDLNLNAAGATLENVDRGHGGRDSLHSAVLAPNFIPPNTDIVLWEFAINDHFQYMENPLQMRSAFIAWLLEMEKVSPRPPKVILVYLWDFKFECDEEAQKVLQTAYEAHAHLAKEFDFVVGFINTASYLNELEMPIDDIKQVFLADVHHPNETGNLAVAFLLLNLLRGEGIWNNASKMSNEITNSNGVKEFQWHCDTVANFPGWRSPLGSATLELPQNDLMNEPIPRQMVFDLKPSDEILMFGKASPTRRDRKRGTQLACCATTTDNINDHLTTVIVPKGATPMQNVASLYMGFYTGSGIHLYDNEVNRIRVYLGTPDNNIVEAPGKLYRDNCRVPWVDFSSFWFDFADEHPNISNVHMCIENDHCENDGASAAMITAVVVY